MTDLLVKMESDSQWCRDDATRDLRAFFAKPWRFFLPGNPELINLAGDEVPLNEK
jgi:hypothetical protein